MFPVNTWGKEFTLIPLRTRFGDVARVVASEDGTIIKRNSTEIALNRGEYYSFLFYFPEFLDSNKPISVAHFSRSQSCDATTGDPFMIMLSPNEQMLTHATFNALEVHVIENYYLNLILETANVDRFQLDGNSISSSFSVLGQNPKYSFAQLDILQGNHTVESDSGFIAYVYGYGNIESFGYSAGITLDNLALDVSTFDPISRNEIPTDSICIGETVHMSVSGDEKFTNFSWYFGDGSSAIGDTVSHAYSVPGEYFARVVASTASGDCGFEEQSRAKIIVLDPTVTVLGPPSVCPNTEGVIYSVTYDDHRDTFDWVVNEGVIKSLDYDSIIIDWGATSSSAYIEVTTTNYLGCVGVPYKYPVKINVQLDPLLPIGPDTLCSSENPGNRYFVYSNPTSVYQWKIEGGTIQNGQGNNEIEVDWSGFGYKKISYEESSTLVDICSGKSDTLEVYIEREPEPGLEISVPDEIYQGDIICPLHCLWMRITNL